VHIEKRTIIKWLLYAVFIIILTALTQVGGLIFIASLVLCHLFGFSDNLWRIFPAVYVLTCLFLVPKVAPFFGREKVVETNNLKKTHWLYALLNRNYVTPEMNAFLLDVSEELVVDGVQINVLDANFPFFNGFPLLPHLSHNDGKKIDLSLVYETDLGEITNLQKSRSGYGVFEGSKEGEYNQVEKCKSAGYFQYDYPRYLTFGKINEELKFSEEGTKLLIGNVLKDARTSKVFLEPYLVKRLGVEHPKMRFHGCGAVRHDDHVHIQIK
jgi:hypothetical protein